MDHMNKIHLGLPTPGESSINLSEIHGVHCRVPPETLNYPADSSIERENSSPATADKQQMLH